MDSRKYFGLACSAASARRSAAQGQSGRRRSRKTMREQMAEHRANPVCASCHKAMDSIGFAMENFDAVGAWRTARRRQSNRRLRRTGDGTKIDGVVSLRKALISRPELFAGTLTEKLLIYALGRGLDYRDMPTVRAILRDASRDNYRFSSLILGVVHSTPFQMRTASRDSDAAPIQSAQNQKSLRRQDRRCSLPRNPCSGGPCCAARARPWRCRCSTPCSPRSSRWPKLPRNRACDSAWFILPTAPSCSSSLPRPLARASSSRRF